MIGKHRLMNLASIAILLAMFRWQTPLAAAQPPHQEAIGPTTVDLTFGDLGYTEQMLRNDSALAQYVLYMPQNFQLSRESYVEIVFGYFIIAGTIPASLEVSLNDLPLGDVSFSQEELLTEGDQRRVRLPLDETSLEAGRNRLEITLDTNEVCGSYEPEVEVTVYATSYFHLVYDTPLLEPDLRTYPYPFYERAFRRSQVYIVLPQEPSAADLSAAATISAGLGRLASSTSRLNITSALDTDLTPEIRDNYDLIVIGQPGRNLLMDQLPLLFDGMANGVEPDDGVIQVMSSPWNSTRAIRVVTGQSDLALYRASAALHRLPSVPGLRGSASIVKEVAAPPPTARRPQCDRRSRARSQTCYGALRRSLRRCA